MKRKSNPIWASGKKLPPGVFELTEFLLRMYPCDPQRMLAWVLKTVQLNQKLTCAFYRFGKSGDLDISKVLRLGTDWLGADVEEFAGFIADEAPVQCAFIISGLIRADIFAPLPHVYRAARQMALMDVGMTTTIKLSDIDPDAPKPLHNPSNDRRPGRKQRTATVGPSL